MKYLNEEVKSLAFDLIMKKSKLGWKFQGYQIEENSYEDLMMTFHFSNGKSNKVVSSYCFRIDDDLEYAKANLEIWIKQARKPYEENTNENN